MDADGLRPKNRERRTLPFLRWTMKMEKKLLDTLEDAGLVLGK